MNSRLLLSVKDALIQYDKEPLFKDLSFNIHEGARIALVGKNGAGKSTLMNIITGEKELDGGERWEENGVSIGYLHQDITPQEGQTVFDYIFTEIKEEDKDLHAYKVEMVTDSLQIDPNAFMTILSGGQLRRAGLARALVEEPDILLLDEPTNHLDLEIIQWLEKYLKNYRGTILCVSHDRAFLANITNQVFWLDRSKVKVSPNGFSDFEEWSTLLLEQEERELKNRKQMVGLEVDWANKGVKARRKRNVRRVEQMKIMRDQLRADQSSYRKATQKIQLQPLQGTEENAKIVAEFYNVSKSFEDESGKVTNILENFSYRIQRGDRIGILGKNGSGKTTFLKLLIDSLKADSGSIKRRKELEFSYFDQKRSDLHPEHTLKKVLSPVGNDYINVMGKERHICGYLKDFMFDPSRIDDRVCNLSGGQKNRLMLAKILANPKSCLIMDEPTNDLDMETLDMLEEILAQYKGTLLVVSHDRDFLDQTVTKIIAFEGNAKIDHCIGGYSDYIAMKEKERAEKPKKPKKEKPKNNTVPDALTEQPKKPKKLSYKLEYELSELPKKIEAVSAEIEEHNSQLRDPDFYQKDPNGFHSITKSLGDAQAKIDRYETRWLELDDMKSK